MGILFLWVNLCEQDDCNGTTPKNDSAVIIIALTHTAPWPVHLPQGRRHALLVFVSVRAHQQDPATHMNKFQRMFAEFNSAEENMILQNPKGAPSKIGMSLFTLRGTSSLISFGPINEIAIKFALIFNEKRCWKGGPTFPAPLAAMTLEFSAPLTVKHKARDESCVSADWSCSRPVGACCYSHINKDPWHRESKSTSSFTQTDPDKDLHSLYLFSRQQLMRISFSQFWECSDHFKDNMRFEGFSNTTSLFFCLFLHLSLNHRDVCWAVCHQTILSGLWD